MVFISLMQKHRRALRDEGETDLSIGFVIYNLPDDYKVFVFVFHSHIIKFVCLLGKTALKVFYKCSNI